MTDARLLATVSTGAEMARMQASDIKRAEGGGQRRRQKSEPLLRCRVKENRLGGRR